MLTGNQVALFLADKFHDDLCEGSANELNLTMVYHHDEVDQVTVESMTGELFTITISRKE